MKRILLSLAAIGPLVASVAFTGPVSAEGWSISGTCVPEQGVFGTITFPAGTGPFEVSLQDHVPGDAQFKPVADSSELIVPGPTDTSASFGPLFNGNVRENANSLRVVNSISNEKSPSFPPCEAGLD